MDNTAPVNKGAFRIKDWWSKASLLMGMVYLFALRYHLSFEVFIPLSILSLITIGGFAATGYLFNDLFDIEKDAIAGKKNFLAGKSKPVIVLLFLLSASFVLLPWLYLPKGAFSFILIGLQLLLFIVYSAPPVRLKERGVAGIVTDALYAHSLPAFLAAYTFSLAGHNWFPTADVLVLFAWQTLAGVRNIILHQADDKEADKKANSKNFVSGLTIPRFHELLKLITAVELLLCLAFFFMLLSVTWLFGACLLLVFALTIADFPVFVEKNSSAFLSSTWKFFPNNIYEKWLPVAYLAMLSASDLHFIILLVMHIALFNFDFYMQVADRLYGLWKSVPFKGYLVLVRIFFSYPINYFIYYTMRLFGIDLRKENTSATAYFKRRWGLRGDKGK